MGMIIKLYNLMVFTFYIIFTMCIVGKRESARNDKSYIVTGYYYTTDSGGFWWQYSMKYTFYLERNVVYILTLM